MFFYNLLLREICCKYFEFTKDKFYSTKRRNQDFFFKHTIVTKNNFRTHNSYKKNFSSEIDPLI